MDTRQLIYFIEIAESKTITAAAKKLHIAQPALSQSLRMLEDTLGVVLIIRDRKQHTLTPAGTLLYQEAKEIITKIEDLKRKVQSTHQEFIEVINVGIDPVSSHLLLPAIRQMKIDYPHIKINIHQNESNLLHQLVRQNKLDFAIVGLPINTTHLETIILDEEPFYFICSKSDKKRTHIESLPHKIINPLILPSNQALGSYKTILEHLKNNSETVRNVSSCSDIDLLLTMVEEDMGCSILPQSAISETNFNIDILSIKDPNLASTTGLIYSKDLKITSTFSHFIDTLLKSIKNKKIA